VRRSFEEFHDARARYPAGIVATVLFEKVRQGTRMPLSTFLDYQLSKKQIGEGDKVASVLSGRGIHPGVWESPAGCPLSHSGATRLRFSFAIQSLGDDGVRPVRSAGLRL
jgi:hypothetical protein